MGILYLDVMQYKFVDAHINIQAHIHNTHIAHTNIYEYKHTHILTHIRAHMNSHTHAHELTHTCARAYSHTHILTHTHDASQIQHTHAPLRVVRYTQGNTKRWSIHKLHNMAMPITQSHNRQSNTFPAHTNMVIHTLC